MRATAMYAECSSAVILKISQLEFDWKTLGRRLISPSHVFDIDHEEHNEQNRRERMLLTWWQQEGSNATYRCLVDALQILGDKATAEKVTTLVEGEKREVCVMGGVMIRVSNELQIIMHVYSDDG